MRDGCAAVAAAWLLLCGLAAVAAAWLLWLLLWLLSSYYLAGRINVDITRKEHNEVLLDRHESELEDILRAGEEAFQRDLAERRLLVQHNLVVARADKVVDDAARRQALLLVVAEPLARRDALDDRRRRVDVAVLAPPVRQLHLVGAIAARIVRVVDKVDDRHVVDKVEGRVLTGVAADGLVVHVDRGFGAALLVILLRLERSRGAGAVKVVIDKVDLLRLRVALRVKVELRRRKLVLRLRRVVDEVHFYAGAR